MSQNLQTKLIMSPSFSASSKAEQDSDFSNVEASIIEDYTVNTFDEHAVEIPLYYMEIPNAWYFFFGLLLIIGSSIS